MSVDGRLRAPLRGWRIVAGAMVLAAALLAAPGTLARPSAAASPHVPALAYFYIWFDSTSWDRAKADLPLAGKYSSDDRALMEQQVSMAKAAGLDGFIVSWKSTPKLDRRLAQLADVAEEQNFKLVVIYEGLDFNRNPTPTATIASDLDLFISSFASRPAFHLFTKPMVILSGSWEYSPADIGSLGAGRRDKILLLGSEKAPSDVQRLRGLVDGDAYYWSSVNPATFPGYQDKLNAMAAEVHADGGLWIAPAASGFDASLLGKTTVVDRLGGQTLRTEFAAASSAAPDAIGVISWNEFSENSHIEPSRQYGDQSLQTLAQLLGGQAGSAPPDVLDSSEPGGRGSGWSQAAALGSVTVLTVVAAAVLVRRHRRAARARAYAAFPGELTDFPWELIDFPWELSEDPWEQTDSRPQ